MHNDLMQEDLEKKHPSYDPQVLQQYSLQQLYTGGFEYLHYFLQLFCNETGL